MAERYHVLGCEPGAACVVDADRAGVGVGLTVEHHEWELPGANDCPARLVEGVAVRHDAIDRSRRQHVDEVLRRSGGGHEHQRQTLGLAFLGHAVEQHEVGGVRQGEPQRWLHESDRAGRSPAQHPPEGIGSGVPERRRDLHDAGLEVGTKLVGTVVRVRDGGT